MTEIKQETDVVRVVDASAITAAAAEHGWTAEVESKFGAYYHKGEQTLSVAFAEDGTVREAIFYRGEIGLAHLAPTDLAGDSALRWLAGLSA